MGIKPRFTCLEDPQYFPPNQRASVQNEYLHALSYSVAHTWGPGGHLGMLTTLPCGPRSRGIAYCKPRARDVGWTSLSKFPEIWLSSPEIWEHPSRPLSVQYEHERRLSERDKDHPVLIVWLVPRSGLTVLSTLFPRTLTPDPVGGAL